MKNCSMLSGGNNCFQRRMPHGTAAAYSEGVKNASLERMARLVKIVGMLLQTKVYLFWRKS